MYLMYIQQVQQQYSKVQHSTAHSPRVDVLCMQYSRYSRYSRYSSTAQYSKVDVPPELWRYTAVISDMYVPMDGCITYGWMDSVLEIKE